MWVGRYLSSIYSLCDPVTLVDWRLLSKARRVSTDGQDWLLPSSALEIYFICLSAWLGLSRVTNIPFITEIDDKNYSTLFSRIICYCIQPVERTFQSSSMMARQTASLWVSEFGLSSANLMEKILSILLSSSVLTPSPAPWRRTCCPPGPPVCTWSALSPPAGTSTTN